MLVQPPPPQVVYVAAPPPRPSRRAPLVAIIVLALLVALLGGFLVARELGAPTPISLEPVATVGADPWMPSVGTDALDVRPVANVTGGRYSGATPGLYGGSGSDQVCDRAQLSRFLGDHPDRAAAWAAVLGLSGSSAATISNYVEGLTPVVLRSDTAVTNHGWRAGQVTSFSSVLQAGTAVLVNSYGTPVTRCFCGNPLSVPMSFSAVTYYGPRWVTFNTTAVTVIQQSTTVTNNYTLVDVRTGEGQQRPAGTAGEQDVQVPAPTEPLTGHGPNTPEGSTPPDPSEVSAPGSDTGESAGTTVDQPFSPRLAPGSGTSTSPSSPTSGPTSATSGTSSTPDPTGRWTAGPECALGTGVLEFDSLPTRTYTVGGTAAGTWELQDGTLTLTPTGGAAPITLRSDGTDWSSTGTGHCTLTPQR